MSQDDPPPMDSAQGDTGLLLSLIEGQVVGSGQSLEAAKSDVVPVCSISWAWVAQPDDEAMD